MRAYSPRQHCPAQWFSWSDDKYTMMMMMMSQTRQFRCLICNQSSLFHRVRLENSHRQETAPTTAILTVNLA